MPDANLYLDRIDLSGYLSDADCKKCGAQSCKELAEKLKRGSCRPDELSSLPASRIQAMQAVLSARGLLPVIPSLQLPRPGPVGLTEINGPVPGDPVLVTGNSQFTQEVLLAVLSTTLNPFFVVFSDTRGDTLDMAVILGSFTPERVLDVLEHENLAAKAGSSTLTIPGLAAGLLDDLAAATGWKIEVGPVCAAELPLYFSDHWTSSRTR